MGKRQLILHTDFNAAQDRIRECHESVKDGLGKEHLKVLGPSGAGKTTLLRDYAANYPRYEADDRTIVPVLYARIPARPTIKKVATSLLRALGSDYADKGDEESRTHQLLTLLAECGTELLLIDELQHLVDRGGKKTHALIADWIKDVVDQFDGACVLAGLTRSQLLDAANEQFARRFSSEFYMGRFDPTTDAGVTLVRGVQWALCRQLDLKLASDFNETNLGTRTAFATDGIMGYITKLFVAVSRMLRREKAEHARLDHFARAFGDVIWPNAPDNRNPFIGDGVDTRLTGPGEPFAPDAAANGWDD